MKITATPIGSVVETMHRDVEGSWEGSGRFFKIISVARDGKILCEKPWTHAFIALHPSCDVRLLDPESVGGFSGGTL